MQSTIQMKTRSLLSAVAGILFIGMLSACGGGSGGGEVDPIKRDDSVVIIPGENPLNKYIGTYPGKKCWTNSTSSEIYSGMSDQVILSASDKPNTLNVTDTTFYYQYGENSVDRRCGVLIGSSTAYGELTYLGTLPSVEFTNSSMQPLRADKFQTNFSRVINQGVYGDRWDEVSDFKKDVKGLCALDGNTVYFADYDSSEDAEGFPTKLDAKNYLVPQ